MPIYEYRCEACRRTHEVIQKLDDALLKSCPVCGSFQVEKILSVSAIIVRESISLTGQGSRYRQDRTFDIDATLPKEFMLPAWPVSEKPD